MRRCGIIGTVTCLLALLMSGCAANMSPSASLQAQLDAGQQISPQSGGVVSLAAGDNLGRQIWAQDVYLATGRHPTSDMLATVVLVEE